MLGFAGAIVNNDLSAAALAALPELADVESAIVLVVTGRNIDDKLHTRAVTRPESFPD